MKRLLCALAAATMMIAPGAAGAADPRGTVAASQSVHEQARFYLWCSSVITIEGRALQRHHFMGPRLHRDENPRHFYDVGWSLRQYAEELLRAEGWLDGAIDSEVHKADSLAYAARYDGGRQLYPLRDCIAVIDPRDVDQIRVTLELRGVRI